MMNLDRGDSAEWRLRMDLLRVARNLIGVPYVYGGQDKDYGLDCSGFIVHCLRAVGLLRPTQDMTAQQLADACTEVSREALQPADLVFYGRDWGSVEHVVMAIGLDYAMGATRGDRSCTTPDIARRKKAAIATLDLDARKKDRLGYGRIVNPEGIPDWTPRPLDMEPREIA